MRALGIVGILRCWPRLYVLLLRVVFLCLNISAECDDSKSLHTQKCSHVGKKQTNTPTHT